MQNEVTTTAAKASPGIIVSIFELLNASLPTLILWLTFIYTAAQTYLIVRRLWRERAIRKHLEEGRAHHPDEEEEK